MDHNSVAVDKEEMKKVKEEIDEVSESPFGLLIVNRVAHTHLSVDKLNAAVV